MRSKELVNDYRYFPEPDIPPVVVSQKDIERVQEGMPELPKSMMHRFMSDLELSEYDASLLTAEKDTAMYFQDLISQTKHFKAAANWINGPLRSFMNENAIDIGELNVPVAQLAELIELVEGNKISFSAASQKVLPEMIKLKGTKDVMELVQQMNLIQVGDEEYILQYIREALAQYPDKVEEYRAGKKGLLGLFVGEVMKKSQGKADPKKTSRLLVQELEK